MKKVACSGPNCSERRIHWERPDTPRGTQWIEVPDEFDESTEKAWCSMTCAIMGGAMKYRLDKQETKVDN